MKFHSLPQDMQETIKGIASQYPFTIEDVTELYLMGGEHTGYLCQLKNELICKYYYPNVAVDMLIQMENNRLWDEKNKRLWDELT